jgi:hypothetical protein
MLGFRCSFLLLCAVLLVPSARAADEEPFTELPILTWQQELELQSTIRQVVFNGYLPLLARSTHFRGVHNDAVPNQVSDWAWQRKDVQDQLQGRQQQVDVQRRQHAALGDAEINAMMSRKQAFRPEHLEVLLTSMPRFDDLIVRMERVQPLGSANGVLAYRCDFEVKTKVGAVAETTRFEAVEIQYNEAGQSWQLPMQVLLDVAPLARTAAGSATKGFEPVAWAGAAIDVVLNTAEGISPVPLTPVKDAVHAVLPGGPQPAP